MEVSLFNMAIENAEDFLVNGDIKNESLVYKHARVILKYGLEEGKVGNGIKTPDNCKKIVNELFNKCCEAKGLDCKFDFTILGV